MRRGRGGPVGARRDGVSRVHFLEHITLAQWTAHIVRNEPTQLAPALAMQKLVGACYKVSATMCGATLMQLFGISHTYGIAALATAVCIVVLSLCGPDSAVFSRSQEGVKLQ